MTTTAPYAGRKLTRDRVDAILTEAREKDERADLSWADLSGADIATFLQLALVLGLIVAAAITAACWTIPAPRRRDTAQHLRDHIDQRTTTRRIVDHCHLTSDPHQHTP